MSQHYASQASTSLEENIASAYVNSIPKSMTFDEIKEATLKDPILMKSRECIHSGNFDKQDPELKRYIQSATSFSFTVIKFGDVILKDTRIVIPEVLHKRVTKLAHVGHQGEKRTKKLMKEKDWFPQMDKKVKDLIDKCTACQSIGPANPPEPMRVTLTESAPRNSVAIDFYGPIPNTSQYLLVCKDLYSKLPEAEIVDSTEARTVIPHLDSIWARHGIPQKLRCDNGPPYNGTEFKNYTKALGINGDPVHHYGLKVIQMQRV